MPPNVANVLGGRRAKAAGDRFENFLSHSAQRQKFEVIRIPNGCKSLGRNRLMRVPSPFDMVLVRNGKAIFLDAKTTQTKTFSKSSITTHQMFSLSRLESQGFAAGYLCNFSNLNAVSFFSAYKLMDLKFGESLKPEDGIVIGNSEDINLELLLG